MFTCTNRGGGDPLPGGPPGRPPPIRPPGCAFLPSAAIFTSVHGRRIVK